MPKRIAPHRGPRLVDPVRAYEASASRRADRAFYASAPWRKVRASHLAMFPLCADCNPPRFAEHVHHLTERKDDPDRAYDPENLQSLCASCHNRKRRH